MRLAEIWRRRPALLVLLAAILLAVAAAGLTWPRVERFFAARTAETAEATLALTLEALRGELARAAPLPALLAERPILAELLRDPENDGLLPFANEQLRQTAMALNVSDIYLMTRDGMTIASSNYRRDTSFIGRRFDYRPYFTEALAGGPGRFHALGTTSGQRGYFFAAPVLVGTEILGVIAVKITLEDIEASWAAGPMDVLVVDQSNVVFLSDRADWRFRTITGLADGAIGAIETTRQYPLPRLQPLDGFAEDATGGVARVSVGAEDYIAAIGLVAGAGWRVWMLAPSDAAMAQARLATALVALLVLSAGLLLALYVQRRARLLERLEVQAQARQLLEARVAERTAQLRQEVEDRRTAEQELRRTQTELVQAGKLAALGQMSAALSHEFNQPLAAVKAYADNAAAFLDRDQDDAARKNIGLISQMADRMATISKHLRNFARRPQDKTGPIPLVATIEEAIQLMQPQIDAAGAELRFDRPDAEVWVEGGRVRLAQVMVNLISNALDAMVARHEKPIEIGMLHQETGWRVAVRDHGPGIAVEAGDQIFDPFFSTKGPAGQDAAAGGSGLGLGLSISYNIMRDFGGSLSVAAHPGGGAVFYADLKAAVAPDMAAQ